MKKAKDLFELFITLFKIGLFTFGGGYAMLALLESELVEKKGWLEKDEFLDMVAIAESTPGPIAINCATYVGYKRGGVIGSACSTLGVVLPSFIIIYTISLFLDAFLTFELVSYAFRGIQAGVVYLILSAGVKMLKGMKRDPMSIVVMCSVLVIMIAFSVLAVKFSAILFILISGVAGLAVHYIGKMKAKRGGDNK
ncbi:MAG: chromate transporter [Clostridia bacterium]|nr:chromate transporter [Clostridia bacterium]